MSGVVIWNNQCMMGNSDHNCLCCGWWTLMRLDQSLRFLCAPYTRSRETAVLCEKVKLGGCWCRFPGFCVLRIRCIRSPRRTLCGWLCNAGVWRVFSFSNLKVWGFAHHSRELEVRMLSTLGTTPFLVLSSALNWHWPKKIVAKPWHQSWG